jgi:cytochrome c biogenesis protein CcdA
MHAITTLELTRVFYLIVTVAAFVLAMMEIRAFIDYKPGFMAVEMPMFLRPYAKKVTSEATSSFGVILAAVFCSLFLIPCSSGPYLIVLGMLAKAATLQTVSYLLLYNFIFILPMLVITVLIFFGKTTVEKIGKAKDRYIRYIHLASGIILFILFFLMVTELSRIF